MTTLPSAPVDTDTADALALMRLDPRHHTDRDIIVAAVEMVAAEHGGVVDPNELRRLVTGRVQPNVIGAVVQGLAKKGVLEPHGFTVTTGSSSHNNGRPARVWRYTDPRSPSPHSAAGPGRAAASTPPSSVP